MVFNNNIVVIVCIILLIWNTILSIVLYRMMRHYNRLTGGASGMTLKSVLDTVLKTESLHTKSINAAEHEIRIIQDQAKFHIQRVGLLRFNPFADTGGSQSFTLALMDSADNGIVMTTLYARTGNRWYIKQVKAGRGVGLDLSKEEISAIGKAKPVSDFKA